MSSSTEPCGSCTRKREGRRVGEESLAAYWQCEVQSDNVFISIINGFTTCMLSANECEIINQMKFSLRLKVLVFDGKNGVHAAIDDNKKSRLKTYS